MPVRNFYVSADIMGRRTTLGGGPRGTKDGMTLHITQRDEGAIETAYTIMCRVNSEGKLITRVQDKTGKVVSENITERG